MRCSLKFAILALVGASPVLSHNFVVCSDAYPDLAALDSGADRSPEMIQTDRCRGYPRAYPTNESGAIWDQYGDQGWPWQGIWPLHDGAALTNHRALNWLQENPVYDPERKEAHVKPESTILVQVQTNNHDHEWKLRQPGRHLIFLAGKAGTQITSSNQLTWDRLVFSAPVCKYAHIVGEPSDEYGGFDGDPGFTWLPLKLVDPTGAWLPEGTYQFIFAYFWSTGGPDFKDYMIPSYTSAFDIVISNDADSKGAVPNCNDTETACHSTLVGNSSCPGAKDTAAPWPPYKNNGAYLFTNPDGDDPSTPNGQRTFQPFWTEYIEASPMPAISYASPQNIKGFSDDDLLKPIPIAGSNSTFPKSIDEIPSISAGKTQLGDGANPPGDPTMSLPITQKYIPMSVTGGGAAAIARRQASYRYRSNRIA